MMNDESDGRRIKRSNRATDVAHRAKWHWFGCGLHIDQALRGVPEKDRCLGWQTGKCLTTTSRTRTRVEKIEVIGAGLGRTGTKILQAALDMLNYRHIFSYLLMMQQLGHRLHKVLVPQMTTI